MNEQRFPESWDEQRVKQLIAELDAQTEEEWLAVYEAAHEAKEITWMAVPTELVPEVRALIASKQST